jgi:hypothetical protein
MSVTVETEGRQVLRFCAEIVTAGVGSGRLQALVDGVALVTGPALPPGASLQFSIEDSFAPACFQWVTPELAPGLHAFEVQWRTFGDSTQANHRVLTVEQR